MSQAADSNSQALLACSFCGMATPHSVLAQLGARCTACYGQYLREAGKGAPRVPREAVPSDAGGRAWAWRLKWREENAAKTGEQITELQRSMWRSVIEAHSLLDDVRDGKDATREAIDEALLATGDLQPPDHLDAPMFDEFGAQLA